MADICELLAELGVSSTEVTLINPYIMDPVVEAHHRSLDSESDDGNETDEDTEDDGPGNAGSLSEWYVVYVIFWYDK